MCSLVKGDASLLETEHIPYASLSRRQVRSLVFYLLYAADGHSYEDSLESIADNLNRGFDLDIPFDSEVFKLAQEIIAHNDILDERIKPFLHNWRYDRVGLCTKLILRYAMYEIGYTDVPANIVINEAVELAKCFSEKDAYKFINGILDEAIKEKESQQKEA
jgi:N utilization substance protein B